MAQKTFAKDYRCSPYITLKDLENLPGSDKKAKSELLEMAVEEIETGMPYVISFERKFIDECSYEKILRYTLSLREMYHQTDDVVKGMNGNG